MKTIFVEVTKLDDDGYFLKVDNHGFSDQRGFYSETFEGIELCFSKAIKEMFRNMETKIHG